MDKKQELLELADCFIENEESLARLYEACIEFLPDHANVWTALLAQEQHHAGMFRQIRRAIEETSSGWHPGKFFPQTLRLMTADLVSLTAEIRARKVNPRYVVQHMMDTENSLIESELSKAFSTTDPVCTSLLGKLQEETQNHRMMLRNVLTRI
ncbi:MAG TPA: hypothetical protein PLP29_03985 [Candidatus Ozemobacteraceae bacterium]|nr:hypothetical protein [Candidatus Ozemobacteraceae bacterium]